MAKKIIEGDILSNIESLFGKNTIRIASEKKLEEVKEWIGTGSLSLDRATNGGIPKGGKCTCILGKESSSKTTLLLHIIAEDQKKGNLAFFADVEGTLDLEYAKAIGVDLDKLHIIDRESYLKHLGIKDREDIAGEEWLELTSKVLKSNIYGIVGMDSVAALIPASEIQSGITGGRLASVASMMARAYRNINSALLSSRSAFVYLNQYRMNPGGYVPLTEPGGEAWKYLQSLKIEISKSVDKDSEGAYGIIVKGKITKSKVCIPYKTFEYYVEFGKGIIREKEVLDLAIEKDLIKKGGAWFTLNEDVKLQGEDAVIQFLKDNPGFTKELEIKITNIENSNLESKIEINENTAVSN